MHCLNIIFHHVTGVSVPAHVRIYWFVASHRRRSVRQFHWDAVVDILLLNISLVAERKKKRKKKSSPSSKAQVREKPTPRECLQYTPQQRKVQNVNRPPARDGCAWNTRMGNQTHRHVPYVCPYRHPRILFLNAFNNTGKSRFQHTHLCSYNTKKIDPCKQTRKKNTQLEQVAFVEV